MAITTYSELQQGVKNFLQHHEIDFLIPDFITVAEKKIFRELRTRDMEEALSSAISSGVIAVPSDFVALKHAYVDGSPTSPLEVRSASWIYRNYQTRSSDSKPVYIAVDQGNFIFGPYPDSTYTIKGTYYKRLTGIATSANALFTNNPDLYLAASLVEAAQFCKEPDVMAYWAAKYEEIKNDLNNEEQNAYYTGSILRASPH